MVIPIIMSFSYLFLYPLINEIIYETITFLLKKQKTPLLGGA